jgi:hypothetical protein
MRVYVGFYLLLAALCVAQSPRETTPFTLTQVSRRFDATGKLTSETRFLFASDQAGSIVSVDLNPGAHRERQIIDVSSHQIILVNPDSKTASDMPHHSSPANPSQACETRFRSIVGAVVAVETTSTTTYGFSTQRISVTVPGGLTMELVVAPDLRCRMLESTTTVDGRVVERLVSQDVTIGPPDPLLFQVPADYKRTHLSLP